MVGFGPGPGTLALSHAVLAEGLGFPEGPRWHDGALWLSDIAARTVLRLDRDGYPEVVCEVPGRPSGLGWLPDGRLLVVSMEDALLLRLDDGELVVHGDLGPFAHGHMNDMVVDADGGAYIGQFGYDVASEAPRSVGLVRVEPDGAARVLPEQLFRPNGCVITPDGRSLLVAETHLRRVSELPIGDDGDLGPRRTFAELDDGWADGICLDAEGAVWIGDPRGQRCLRVERGGRVTHVVDTAPHACVACALGGPDGHTLFLMVGVLGGGFVERDRVRDGRVDVARAPVAAAAPPRSRTTGA